MNLEQQIEQLIDANGLATVLDAIARVCSEKADHIETNWQDSVAAKAWNIASGAISNCAHTRRKHGLDAYRT